MYFGLYSQLLLLGRSPLFLPKETNNDLITSGTFPVRKFGGEEGAVLQADAGMTLLHSSQSYFFTLSGEINSRIMLKTTAWIFFFIFLLLYIYIYICTYIFVCLGLVSELASKLL